MALPNINISFSAKAESAIVRSAKGIVCLVLDDTTSTSGLKSYKALSEVAEDNYTAENYKIIKDTFFDGAPTVNVVKIGNDEDFEDAQTIIDAIDFNWMCYCNGAAQADVVTYVKDRNLKNPNRQIKAVVYNASAPNDMHIVNFANTSVKRKEDATAISGHLFLGRLAGLFAALPFTESATYHELPDVESVTAVTDETNADESGKLIIINDYGEPKIGRAVNSLTTIASGGNDSMKKITVVEAMDLIRADIATTFKENYVGKYKNNLNNQQVFLSAVNFYFLKLQREQILDEEFNNEAVIDVETQRIAIIDAGHTEASEWNDYQVKKFTVGSKMFMAGNVKILDAIEDLTFGITMA